jgi:hypothetical protein
VNAAAVLREGQIVRGPWLEKVLSRTAEAALGAGKLVKFGTSPAYQVIELPALPVADVDAIATAAVVVSAAVAHTVAPAAFNGAIGRDRIVPCRTISVNFSASADWDTGTGECLVDIYGHDAAGTEIHDTVARPNSGAVLYAASTRLAFADVDRIDIQASNGAGGTATVGVSNDKIEFSPADYPGVALYEAIKEPGTAAREFVQYDDVSVLQSGVVAVKVEHAVSIGDPVYVRHTAAGADLAGQFTGSDGADTPTTYGRLAGARFRSAAAIDGLAQLELVG